MTNTQNQRRLVTCPGSGISYGGSLRLWQNSQLQLQSLEIPEDLTVGVDVPVNSWIGFMRFTQNENEHKWFTTVAALMSKYCQFFNGSLPLEDCPPSDSASGAVKMTVNAVSSLFAIPQWNPGHGQRTSPLHGDPDVEAHYELKINPTVIIDSTIAIREVPDAHYFSAITYGFNSYANAGAANLNRNGDFWQLAPDLFRRLGINILPGIRATISRDFHVDNRLTVDKQSTTSANPFL